LLSSSGRIGVTGVFTAILNYPKISLDWYVSNHNDPDLISSDSRRQALYVLLGRGWGVAKERRRNFDVTRHEK
jgi:hypothetical protein